MDLNCELCANKKECFDNSWCVTMDRGRKINGQPICDNFELSGRKYEVLKEKNKKLEEVIDMMEEDLLHYNEKQMNVKFVVITANGDTIKDYYFKKARGEENETKEMP